MEARTHILIRDAMGEVRGSIDITGCPWCSDEAICAICHGRAVAARAVPEGRNKALDSYPISGTF